VSRLHIFTRFVGIASFFFFFFFFIFFFFFFFGFRGGSVLCSRGFPQTSLFDGFPPRVVWLRA